MSDNENNIPDNLNEEQELDNILVLNDEEGNEVEFEFLDLIEYEGEEYVVLLPHDEEEDADEVVCFFFLGGFVRFFCVCGGNACRREKDRRVRRIAGKFRALRGCNGAVVGSDAKRGGVERPRHAGVSV